MRTDYRTDGFRKSSIDEIPSKNKMNVLSEVAIKK
jgi:hypothetical protein